MLKKWMLPVLVLSLFCNQPGTSQDSLYLQSLVDSLGLVTDDAHKIDLNLRIARAYTNIDYEKAIEYCDKTIALAKEEYPEQFYTALSVKSYTYYLMHRIDSASAILDRIIRNKEEIKDQKLLLEAHSLLGSIQKRNGELNLARSTLMEVMQRQKSAHDSLGLTTTLNRLGLVWRDLGIYDSAAHYFMESRRMAENIYDSLGILKALGNLGKTFFSMEDYKTARKYFLRAYEIVKITGNKRFEGAIYNNLGITFHKEGTLDSGEYYYRKTLEIFEEVHNRPGMANVYLNLGGLYDGKGLYSNLLKYSNKALDIYRELSNISGVIKANSNIALYYERIEQYDRALVMYDTVLQMAINYNRGEDVIKTYYNIYKLYEKAGNFREAFKYQTIHNQVKDSIINLEKETAIAELEYKYEKEKDEAEILALRNETLMKDLKLRQRTQERNLLTFIGIALILGVLFLIILGRQKMKKDRIIRNKEIERLKEEKKAMSARALVEGQEKERRRVATELHDGIGVLLSSVKLQFSRMEEDLPQNKALLKRATDMIERASGDVRQISHNLMPGNLAKFGIFDALEDLFESVTESGMIKADLDVEGPDQRPPENHEIMIYRIIQELVNNTMKHAEADNISLWIKNEADKITLKYADDGRGFDPEEARQKSTMGIKSIRARVDFLEGELDIETDPGKGTSVFIQVPYEKK